jgi:hypothetical protein
MTQHASTESSVRLNKLASGGYSWTISVAARGEALDDLRLAKEAALRLSSELEAELLPIRQTNASLPF